MIKKHGAARWQGDLKSGTGTVSTETAALKDHPYGFTARFEDGKGTNPEELIGAAHASCFAMAMALNLGEDGFTADSIDATSTVSLEEVDGGFAVTKAHIKVTASIPDISDADFQKIAKATEKGCPISKLLNADITMDATLV